jgi:hypothetical protein
LASNALFARNRDVFSLIDGFGFHLLALSRRPLAREEIGSLADDLKHLAGSCPFPVETHLIAHSLVGRDERLLQAESTQVFEAFGLTNESPQGMFLIRPDGYIAFRSDRLEVGAIGEFLRSKFAVA